MPVMVKGKTGEKSGKVTKPSLSLFPEKYLRVTQTQPHPVVLRWTIPTCLTQPLVPLGTLSIPVCPQQPRDGQVGYLGQLHVCGIAQDGPVGLFVAGVADQLRVPDAEVVLAVRALREDGDGRSARERQRR